MNGVLDLENLSTTELLAGLLLYAEARKFPEQSLYRFLRNLEERVPALRGRFHIVSSGGTLRSEPVRKILNFFEMGKILEVPMPNPVDQFLRPRRTQFDSLRRQLEQRGVIPAQQEALQDIASEFDEFLTTLHNQAPEG